MKTIFFINFKMNKVYTAFLLLTAAISINAQVDDNPKGDDILVVGGPNVPKVDDNPKGDDNARRVFPSPTPGSNRTISQSNSNKLQSYPSYIYLTSLFYMFI